MSERAAAIVLAAGGASRFGGAKLAADLAGRPLLRWVLDAIARAGVRDVVLVLGSRSEEVERAIGPGEERRVYNPDPEAGLATSLRVGLAALDPGVDVALIALGDQPLVRPDVIAGLLARAASGPRPVVVPHYAGDESRNPVALRREAFALVASATGDRGLGPVLAAQPDLVDVVPVEGDNPDVDTTADLERLQGRGLDPRDPSASPDVSPAVTSPASSGASSGVSASSSESGSSSASATGTSPGPFAPARRRP